MPCMHCCTYAHMQELLLSYNYFTTQSSCLSCEASRPCVLCAKGLVPNPCDNCSSTLLLQTFTGSTQDDVNSQYQSDIHHNSDALVIFTGTYAGQELMECVPIVDEDECLHEYFTAEHPVTGVVTIIANSGRCTLLQSCYDSKIQLLCIFLTLAYFNHMQCVLLILFHGSLLVYCS